MKTRLMAGAFLKFNDNVLLMKRGMHKRLNPGKWAPIGGHLEPDEINNPEKACLREIREETGINASDIKDFELRFIIVRNNGVEFVINYLFTGNLIKEHKLPDCDEGTLHWIDYNSFSEYDISFSVKEAAKLLVKKPENRNILLGAVSSDNKQVCWNEL